MSAGLLALVLTGILFAFSSLNAAAFSTARYIAVAVGVGVVASMILDLFLNTPKALLEGRGEMGETYRRMVMLRKKRYVLMMLVSLLLRGGTIALLISWFV